VNELRRAPATYGGAIPKILTWSPFATASLLPSRVGARPEVAPSPRNLIVASVKDVGAVAVEGGKWEIYVGGAAGTHVRKGDLLCTVESHDEVLLYAGRFMQWYRENAKYKERTYTFVQRMGIERVKAVIVADSDKIAASLDKAMQESVDATKDPWLEAHAPKTPNQFAALMTAAGE
jgi:nitrite reductase (NADH) large subunit